MQRAVNQYITEAFTSADQNEHIIFGNVCILLYNGAVVNLCPQAYDVIGSNY